MHQFHTPHVRILFFAVYALVQMIFTFAKWEFISKALCEPQGERPSSRRLGAFYLIQCVVLCEIYYTLTTGIFDFKHLIALLTTILLCWGLVSIDQIIQFVKLKFGGGNTTAPAQPPIIQQEVTTKEENIKTNILPS